MQNAIYYKERYYLLPAEFADYDSFVRDMATHQLPVQYQMAELREDHGLPRTSVTKGCSIAPYFLVGYCDATDAVTIDDVEEVYPTQVELLTQEDYNKKLRELVEKLCPGCQRFKPLSARVQSLNGHFEEMSLDGICLYRQEAKPAPRVFLQHLFSFGGFFRRFRYDENDVQTMRENLRYWFYMNYDEVALREETGEKTLTVRCKKKDLLAPLVTEAIARYTEEISEDTYYIRQMDSFPCTEETLEELLADKNAGARMKECKKYGVSLMVMEYDGAASEKVWRSLKTLVEHFWIFPLLRMEGKCYCLAADTSNVLKELRYRSPLLQSCHTRVEVFDQYGCREYEVSYKMAAKSLEGAL